MFLSSGYNDLIIWVPRRSLKTASTVFIWLYNIMKYTVKYNYNITIYILIWYTVRKRVGRCNNICLSFLSPPLISCNYCIGITVKMHNIKLLKQIQIVTVKCILWCCRLWLHAARLPFMFTFYSTFKNIIRVLIRR